MEKIDFRKTLKAFYAPSAKAFGIVEVPEMAFAMVDGQGDPKLAADYQGGLSWLYTVSYRLKFTSKAELQRDYTVPPLEALWWADDMTAFVSGRRQDWRWTQLIMVPDWITREMFEAAKSEAGKKLGSAPGSLRLERFHEGLSVQILHVGPYDAEAPTIRKLHEEFLPANGLVENGRHHEIYLSDPRRVPPRKLKTVLRQPVRRSSK
ncbi:MAG: GyrI-like domain-containing protein [Cucumibacter sp.]